MKQKLTLSAALLLFTICVQAHFQCGQFYYDMVEGSTTEVEISYMEGGENYPDLTSLVIPSSIVVETFDGDVTYTVSGIGNYAFMGCPNLTSVSIPNTVTYIGGMAFTECQKLTSVVVPDNVTHLANEAFSYCKNLRSVTLSNNITYIERDCFCGCSNLETVVFPERLDTIGCRAFEGCSSLSSVVLPDNVGLIESYAFSDCSGLRSVILGTKLYGIELNAFADCENLRTVISYSTNPAYLRTWDNECAFDLASLPYMTLIVPKESVDTYKQEQVWKKFGAILPNEAYVEDFVEPSPVVEPSDTEMTITWPLVSDADTYTIVVRNGEEIVATLVFDGSGVLLNIVLAAPARNNGDNHSRSAESTQKGFQYTITGLDKKTQYTYSLEARNEEDVVLETFAGTFTTTGVLTSTNHTMEEINRTKIWHDGQLYIVYNEESYNVLGAKIQ